DERVAEGVHVPARLPDGRVHEDGGVEALDVVVAVDHRAPPPLAHVPLELDAKRAVVVDGGEAAVDLGGLEDEAAALGEGDEGVEVGHGRRRRGQSGARKVGASGASLPVVTTNNRPKRGGLSIFGAWP